MTLRNETLKFIEELSVECCVAQTCRYISEKEKKEKKRKICVVGKGIKYR